MDITLRPATDEDLEWLDAFYEKMMRPYVELTHTWNPTRFRACYDPAIAAVVQIDGQDAGLLKVETQDDCVRLRDIQIHENYQNRGVGTQLIQQVLERGRREKRPVRLRVLKGNPAIRLYRRLGFRVIHDYEHCYELEAGQVRD